MILVDTSIWVNHFRRKNIQLEELLSHEAVYCHPLIIGELACGNLHHRNEILDLLSELPTAVIVTDQEALAFIEQHQIMCKGLGMVDVLLLAATVVSNLKVLTDDKVMKQVAIKLEILY